MKLANPGMCYLLVLNEITHAAEFLFATIRSDFSFCLPLLFRSSTYFWELGPFVWHHILHKLIYNMFLFGHLLTKVCELGNTLDNYRFVKAVTTRISSHHRKWQLCKQNTALQIKGDIKVKILSICNGNHRSNLQILTCNKVFIKATA